MLRIALRYSDVPLTSLVFDFEAGEQYLFKCLKLTKAVPNVEVEAGKCLNGRQFAHKKWAHKEFELIISADELADSGALSFIEAFWLANYKYISFLLTDTTGEDYREVITDGGAMPLSYVDDIIDLPEIALKFSYAQPEL